MIFPSSAFVPKFPILHSQFSFLYSIILVFVCIFKIFLNIYNKISYYIKCKY